MSSGIPCLRQITLLCVFFLWGSSLLAQEPLSQSSVGIEGHFHFDWAGDPLEVAPIPEDSPVLVRIAQVNPSNSDEGSSQYDIRWLALLPGNHDLSVFFRHGENRPADLPPMVVNADSLLGSDHEGNLANLPGTLSPVIDFPAWVLWGVAGFWLVLPLLILGILRWMRPPPPAPVVEVVLTIADKLRPYVDQALAGNLDSEGKAALERLLLAFWRDDLNLGSFRHAEALQAMRQHEVAGELIVTVERWLHSGKETATHTEEVEALLQPYKSMPADKVVPE